MKFLRIMGACFVIAGAAVWIAVPMLFLLSIIWILVGVAMFWAAHLFASAEAVRQRVLKMGKAGQATILSASDTNVTINQNPRVKLTVRIDVVGEAPIEATNTMVVSRLNIPRVGDVFLVRFDPNDPNNFAFAPRTTEPIATATTTTTTTDTIGQLERLALLRDKGVLTNEEFLEQKRKLLG